MVRYGQIRHLADMQPFLPAHSDRQGLVIETVALTALAGQFIHIGLHDGAGIVTGSFLIAAVDIVDNTLKGNINVPHPTKFILIVEVKLFPPGAIEDQVFFFL